MLSNLIPFLCYVDIEGTFLKILKWGFYIIVFMIVAWIAGKIYGFFYANHIENKINKLGVKEVIVRRINNEIVDDTFTRAAIGHMIAGEKGMLAGAASGGPREQTKWITFWVRYGDGTKQELTLPPNHRISTRLLHMIEKRDFDNW